MLKEVGMSMTEILEMFDWQHIIACPTTPHTNNF